MADESRPGKKSKPKRPTNRQLQNRLSHAKAKLAAKDRRIEELESEISSLRRRAVSAKAQAAPARESASSAVDKRRATKLDLNAVSFEDLREIGLSVTQGARVIAAREVRDGFTSMRDLDRIRSLSDKTRRLMDAELTVARKKKR